MISLATNSNADVGLILQNWKIQFQQRVNDIFVPLWLRLDFDGTSIWLLLLCQNLHRNNKKPFELGPDHLCFCVFVFVFVCKFVFAWQQQETIWTWPWSPMPLSKCLCVYFKDICILWLPTFICILAKKITITLVFFKKQGIYLPLPLLHFLCTYIHFLWMEVPFWSKINMWWWYIQLQ